MDNEQGAFCVGMMIGGLIVALLILFVNNQTLGDKELKSLQKFQAAHTEISVYDCSLLVFQRGELKYCRVEAKP